MAKPKNTKEFHVFISRGKHIGKLLFPHLHENGQYAVSKTRFEADYVYVATTLEVEKWLVKGFRLRMSNLGEGISATSLIKPENVDRPVVR